MRKTWYVVCALGLLLAPAGRLWSGEEAATRAIITKAIEARGGEAKLAKADAVTMKGTGKFYGLAEEGVPFKGEWESQGADKVRIRIDAKVMDKNFTLIKVVSGDKGWTKFGEDKGNPMPKDVLTEEKEQMYGTWVGTLAPLKDKAFKLTPLGESKVAGKDALGVRVSHAGRRDVNLYFDKQSYLLLRLQMAITAPETGSDKLMSQEIYYDNYKDFGGVRFPTRLSMKRDGKRYVEGDLTDIRAAEKLDANVFAEP